MRRPPPLTTLRTITYSTGMNSKFSVVAAIIPPNTVVPTEILPARPAPVASTKWHHPKINASEVIRMGRKRIFAASIAASTVELAVRPQLFREFHD